jgi:hypothetical protein
MKPVSKMKSALQELLQAFTEYGDTDLNNIPVSTTIDMIKEALQEEEKHFPAGFSSWMETHHEVVAFITIQQHECRKGTPIYHRHESQGTGGLYELAEEWTDEFENTYKDTDWDGEFFDTIEEFLQEKNGCTKDEILETTPQDLYRGKGAFVFDVEDPTIRPRIENGDIEVDCHDDEVTHVLIMKEDDTWILRHASGKFSTVAGSDSAYGTLEECVKVLLQFTTG